jgi:phenylacetate-coenzyme A ligase PaaK-like adenylate-forming protein
LSTIISFINSLPFGNSAGKGYWLYKNVPTGILQNIEGENFRRVVRFVSERSVFYKRKFAEYKIDPAKVQTPADLGNFFTTPEDIR